MVYVYAIVDQPALPMPSILGLEGAELHALEYQDIGAVISQFETGRVSPAEANLWQHEAVIEVLMADHGVLPMRFGTMLADEAAVLEALSSRYDEFTAALDRVRGHVELGLRVLWDDDVFPMPAQSAQPLGGLDYMLVKLDEQRKLDKRREEANALAEDIHKPLAGLAADSTRQTLVTPRMLLIAAYLVESERVEAFRREVEMLSSANPGVRLLCTGPWPAYNFVTVIK